ncbi:MAG: hypothetical protein ABIG45_10550 [Bacillota bacterium]
MRSMMKRVSAAAFALLITVFGHAFAVTITITDPDGKAVTSAVSDTVSNAETNAGIGVNAREALIDAIIDTAQTLYNNANGRWQRAEKSGDIYVCKNFTVYLFLQNADRFRMAEFPGVELNIPRLNKETDDGYDKGIVWEDLSASDGNPFEVAAQFRYNDDLSLEENKEIAHAFMQQVERGDYFQMQASYYWGKGAHSLVFIKDYNPELDTVHWADSNMKTKKENGITYGLVQFNAEKDIDWFVDAFCHPKRGATLYRLRDDIIFAGNRDE